MQPLYRQSFESVIRRLYSDKVNPRSHIPADLPKDVVSLPLNTERTVRLRFLHALSTYTLCCTLMMCMGTSISDVHAKPRAL